MNWIIIDKMSGEWIRVGMGCFWFLGMKWGIIGVGGIKIGVEVGIIGMIRVGGIDEGGSCCGGGWGEIVGWKKLMGMIGNWVGNRGKIRLISGGNV